MRPHCAIIAMRPQILRALATLALLFLLSIALAACSSRTAAHPKPIIDTTGAHICQVHNVVMIQEAAPVSFGYYVSPKSYDLANKARLKNFPNAWRVMRDCVIGSPTTEIYVCPSCEKAQQEWIASHPNDPWVKDHKDDRTEFLAWLRNQQDTIPSKNSSILPP